MRFASLGLWAWAVSECEGSGIAAYGVGATQCPQHRAPVNFTRRRLEVIVNLVIDAARACELLSR